MDVSHEESTFLGGLNMTMLAEFFKGSATTLGVFYPTHCMTAVFRNHETANRTAGKLHMGGFPPDDAIAVTGREVLEFDRDQTTLAGALVRAASRFFKTEQAYTDHDLEHARQGAGFVVVKCPTEETKSAAWAIIQPEDPLDARYYAAGGIEHLAGDPDTD